MLALMYHDVLSGTSFHLSGFQGPDADIYKIDTAEFHNHIAIILAETPSKPPMLTFDDGGVGALNAAAILEELGWNGYFFVTTGRIGTSGFLSEAQIRDLRRRGHIIGSHSRSHPARIAHLTREELDSEWRESVATLRNILGEPVETASIPSGFYSRRVAAAAARAGIKMLFTSEPTTTPWSIDGCVTIGRFAVQRGASARWLRGIIAGHCWPRAVAYLLWNGRKVLKAGGGELWLKARVWALSNRAAARDKTISTVTRQSR